VALTNQRDRDERFKGWWWRKMYGCNLEIVRCGKKENIFRERQEEVGEI
jgi:hypothetical protein